MSSSRSEAFLGLPDWARRLTAQVEVSFRESLSGIWRREAGQAEARLVVELESAAPSARALLDSGVMHAKGTLAMEGLARSATVEGERRVDWRSGRIDLRLRFTGDDGRPYLLVGGWSPGPAPGSERVPFRFRLESGDGSALGQAVLSVTTVEPERPR